MASQNSCVYLVNSPKLSSAVPAQLYNFAKPCAPQYEHNSFVTMVAYWVSDLSTLWRSILIFAGGASSACSSKQTNGLPRIGVIFLELKMSKILKPGLQIISCHGKRIL